MSIVLLLLPQVRFSGYLLPLLLAGIAVGTLIAYTLFRKLFQTIYRETIQLLRDTTFPSQVIDGQFQQRVREMVNSSRLLKEPLPRTLGEQFQFAALFWSDCVAVATNAESAQWTPTQRRLFHHNHMDDFFEPTRLKAICDFFLAEDPTT